MNRILQSELKIIYNEPNIESIQIIKVDKNRCKVVLTSTNTSKCIKYTFLLPDTYPFTKPSMFSINDINYDHFLRVDLKYKHILKQISGADCLCCSSIFCTDNWTVSYQLPKLIDEFKINLQLKQKIYQLYLLNLIKRKYNINFNAIETFF